MQCNQCGAPIIEKKQKYCFHCGAQLRSSKVPTILGCGLSVLLGVLGVGLIAVCGFIAFMASCAYGLSNNSGSKPDLTPYTVGAGIGALLIIGALGSLIYGIVAGVRGSKTAPRNAPPIPPPPSLNPGVPPPLPQQHIWVSPPIAPPSEVSQPVETPLPPDHDAHQAPPGI